MKIINQISKNRNLELEDLSEIRQNLKLLIDLQEEKMTDSAKSVIPFHDSYVNQTGIFHKFSPISLVAAPLKKTSKTGLVDGVIAGFKAFRAVRRFIRH